MLQLDFAEKEIVEKNTLPSPTSQQLSGLVLSKFPLFRVRRRKGGRAVFPPPPSSVAPGPLSAATGDYSFGANKAPKPKADCLFLHFHPLETFGNAPTATRDGGRKEGCRGEEKGKSGKSKACFSYNPLHFH